MTRTTAAISLFIFFLLASASYATAANPIPAPCEPSAIASSIQNAIIEKYAWHVDDYISDIQLVNDACKLIEDGSGTIEYGIYAVTMHGKTQDTHYTVTRTGYDLEIVAGIPYSITSDPYTQTQSIFSSLEKQKLDYRLQQLIYGLEKKNEADKLIWVALYPQAIFGGYGDAVVRGPESSPIAIPFNPVSEATQTPVSAPELIADAPLTSPSNAGAGIVGTSGNPVQVVNSTDAVVGVSGGAYPSNATRIDCASFKQSFSKLVLEKKPVNHYYYSEKSTPYCAGLIQTPISNVRALLRDDIPAIGFFGEKIQFNASVIVPVSYTTEEFVQLAQKIGQQNVGFTPAGVYIRMWEHISDNDALYLSISSPYQQPRPDAAVNATLEVSYYGMQADAHLDEMNARISQRLQELGFHSTFKITPEMKRDPYFGSEPPTIQRENPSTYTDYYYTGSITLPTDLFERVAGWDQQNDPAQITYTKSGNVVMQTKHRMEFHGGDLPNQNSYSILFSPDTILGIFQLEEADEEMAYAKLKSVLSPYLDVPAAQSILFVPYGDNGIIYNALTLERGTTDATTTVGGVPAGNTSTISGGEGTVEQFTGANGLPLATNTSLAGNVLSGDFANIFLVIGIMAAVGVALWFVVRPH